MTPTLKDAQNFMEGNPGLDSFLRRQLISMRCEVDPGFAEFCRRIYEVPASYYSMDHLRCSMTQGFFYRTAAGSNVRNRMDMREHEGTASHVAESLHGGSGYPFYCVGKSIASAVFDTDPMLVWDRVRYPEPWPSTYFLLSKGAMPGPSGHDISVMFLAAATKADLLAQDIGIRDDYAGLLVAGAFDDFGYHWYSTVPLEDKVPLDVERPYVPAAYLEDNPVQRAHDKEFSTKLMAVLAQFVHVLHTRVELTEPEKFKKTARKTGREIWYPRFLGPSYVRPGAQHGRGEGGGVATHMRRGHWRNQRFGKGRAETKVLWIEPCLVGGKP